MIAAATAAPWARATSQCSIRSRRPWTTESYSHASPAAHTPGADVSSVDEQAMPPVSPSASPADRASITSGTAPMPITTRSASSDAAATRSPRAARGRRPRSAPARRSPTQSMPWSRSTPAKNSLAVAPEPERQRPVLLHDQRARLALRRSATRRPRRRCRSRRRARRARPRRRRRGSRRRCRARAGSGCPRGRQPSTRSRRTFAPVASTACPNESSSPGSLAVARLGVELHDATCGSAGRGRPAGRGTCARAPTSPRR